MAAKKTPDQGAPLDAVVAQLARDFALTRGKVALPVAKYDQWKAEMEVTARGDREKRAQGVLALAARFQREGGKAADEGIRQLCSLAAILVGKQKVKAAAAPLGLEKQAQRFLANESSPRAPRVDDKPPAGTLKVGSLTGPRRG
ncbi:MAG: hypothetical protein HY904_25060 [Deltaproteobacteria bacterium]|nr:hypothetical protein [Deltaproteobacteria bacterium]